MFIQKEPSETSGLTEFDDLIWKDLNPEEMSLLEKTSPEERNTLVIGKCNLIEFTIRPIRGHGEKFGFHHGLYKLDKTFSPGDDQEKYTQDPGDEVNVDEANKFMLEWHEKVWQKKNFSVKFERPADMYSRSERPVVIIQNILKEGFGNWDKSYMAPGVKEAIGKIPDPGQIKRVVCVGLGLIECAKFEASLNETRRSPASGASLAQHVAALAIVKQLQDMTKKKVQLYTADPAYGPSHKEALETLDKVESIGIKFNVCDVSYGRHEQYLKINDDTLLFTVAAYCGVLRAVSEYTRPAVMICEGLCRDTNQDPERPSPDYLWYEVKPREIKGMGDERTSVKIPGVPSHHRWSKRVENMLGDEYYVEASFPYLHEAREGDEEEEKGPGFKQREFDLCQVEVESNSYWNDLVRMHVRKRK